MNNRILIFGDSISWGAWDSEGGWVNRLKDYTDNQAISEQLDKYDTIYPLGISGDNSEDLLKRFEDEFKVRVDEDSNMVVVIAIGINDSQFDISTKENRVSVDNFRININKIIKVAKKATQQIVLIGLTPVDENLVNPMPWKSTHGYSNKQIEKYHQVIKDLAKEKSIPLIDFYNDFYQRNFKKLLSDGLHPNTEGHEIIYKKVSIKLKSLGILR